MVTSGLVGRGGFDLYNTSLRLLPFSAANIILTMGPVFTAVLAYFLLDEQLTSLQLVGSLLILGRVLFLRLRDRRRGRIAS